MRNDRAVSNMRTVVEMCTRAVRDRWQKYDELFASVSETVSKKFMGYMHRRGHHVSHVGHACPAHTLSINARRWHLVRVPLVLSQVSSLVSVLARFLHTSLVNTQV